MGLWGIQFGNVNIGWGDPSYLFSHDSWGYFGKSLAATADGIVPFIDPFQRFYDPCDKALQLSKSLGAAARDVALAAAVPNIPLWAKNPVLYEVGSTTLPSAVYEGVQGLNAIQKGSYLISNYGLSGTAKLAGQAFIEGQYANTIGTGLTPGGWLGLMGAGQALDSHLGKAPCGCK
jgi:hypothetical protein